MNLAEVTPTASTQQLGPLKGKCCAKPGDALKGTFFFGGAGLDGPYITKMVAALRNTGIRSAVYMDREK